MQKIELNSMIARNPSFFMHEIDDELICLDEESGNYIGLNQTGKEVWGMLEKPTKVQTIVDAISKRYPTINTIQDDVLEYVNSLHELKENGGLIQII